MNKQANSGLKIAKVLDVEVFYSTQKKRKKITAVIAKHHDIHKQAKVTEFYDQSGGNPGNSRFCLDMGEVRFYHSICLVHPLPFIDLKEWDLKHTLFPRSPNFLYFLR